MAPSDKVFKNTRVSGVQSTGFGLRWYLKTPVRYSHCSDQYSTVTPTAGELAGSITARVAGDDRALGEIGRDLPRACDSLLNGRCFRT